MGGDYYDRDVGTGTTSNANNVITQTNIHSSCNPTRWKDDKLDCTAKNPIVFALDVTGSMGEWTKIIYDKMPMFYGQIMMQKYLEDPCISFCAIGDHGGDNAPLQCTEFGRGNEIDQLIAKIYLEGNGQGNGIEGYEMSAYFYDTRTILIGYELPFLFITGDEGFYSKVSSTTISSLLGVAVKEDYVEGKKMLQDAMKKFNLFLLKKPYSICDSEIIDQWSDAIGKERMLKIKTPKACIDIMLGAICLTSGQRTLDEYIADLKERGQTDDRQVEVKAALEPYYKALKAGKIQVVKHESKDDKLTNLSNSNSNNNNNDLEDIKKQAIDLRLKTYGDIARERDEIQDKLKDQVPKEYLCPITQKIMVTPVSISDGETFEKISIELYFEKNGHFNPLTKEKVDSGNFKNSVINKLIDSFVAQNQA